MTAAPTQEPITVRFADVAQLENEFAHNLKNGGIFISGITGYVERQAVEVCLVHPVNDAQLTLHASVVWVDPTGGGVGVAVREFTASIREGIAAFISDNSKRSDEAVVEEPHWELEVVLSEAPTAEPEMEPEMDPDIEPEMEPDRLQSETDGKDTPGAQSLHDRLRRLNQSEQTRLARTGTVNERIALERIYGKSVWDVLLQNTSLTLPEVTRIARMGSLPMSLVETIVNNPAWLSGPQVRRALLTNPRLRRDLIAKVLCSMPLSELRLVPKQTSYSSATREEAKKLLSRG